MRRAGYGQPHRGGRLRYDGGTVRSPSLEPDAAAERTIVGGVRRVSLLAPLGEHQLRRTEPPAPCACEDLGPFFPAPEVDGTSVQRRSNGPRKVAARTSASNEECCERTNLETR